MNHLKFPIIIYWIAGLVLTILKILVLICLYWNILFRSDSWLSSLHWRGGSKDWMAGVLAHGILLSAKFNLDFYFPYCHLLGIMDLWRGGKLQISTKLNFWSMKMLPFHYLVRLSVSWLDFFHIPSQPDVLPSHPGPREMELLPDLQLWDEEPKTDWLNQILLMLHWLVMTNVPWTPLLEFWHETGTFGTEKLERDWTKTWSRNLRVSAGFSGAMSLSTSTQISLAI